MRPGDVRRRRSTLVGPAANDVVDGVQDRDGPVVNQGPGGAGSGRCHVIGHGYQIKPRVAGRWHGRIGFVLAFTEKPSLEEEPVGDRGRPGGAKDRPIVDVTASSI